MNIPSLKFDMQAAVKHMGELTVKLIEGFENLKEIEEIDVGTAPKYPVYQEDKLTLYHYKQEKKATCPVPVIIVYALVNKQYMLDLQPSRSLVRNLLSHGTDLYIIDWGYPNKADRYLTMDDYIDGYLNNCIDFIRKTTNNDKINIMGICQGGTFSTIYSALYPEKIKNLVTLVTPVDFAQNQGLLDIWAKKVNVDNLVDSYNGLVPGDFLNEGFLMLKPFNLNIGKYVDMISIMDNKDALLNFLRMEKWIFDSPAQAGECYRQFMKDLYQDNKLIKGTLKIGDKEVNLKNITMPLLNIYAIADHLVNPSSTKPLNDYVGATDKELYEFRGGHIGVFVGSKSQKELAPAIAEWLHKRV
jgi:polyhydroxyalkanoate synthase